MRNILNPKKIALALIILVSSFTIYYCTSSYSKEGYSTKDLNEQLVLATLWMQTSGEYRALCYQAFNLAKMNLNKALKKKSKKPLAIVVDADETVIDNSAFQAQLIGRNYGYSSKIWAKWMKAQQAKAIPGAKAFLNYAKKKGVEVFYVTNRTKKDGYKVTINNLKKLKFPYVDKKHMLLKTTTSNKDARRKIVSKKYNIVLFLGDNLNDFTSNFSSRKSISERRNETDKIKSKFGKKFIVFPNPTYGDWLNSVIKRKFGASAAEKNDMHRKALRVWKP